MTIITINKAIMLICPNHISFLMLHLPFVFLSQQSFLISSVLSYIYIYIYQMLLSKATYNCIQVIHFFFSVHVFPGNRTHNLLRCWRNALPLSHTVNLSCHLSIFILEEWKCNGLSCCQLTPQLSPRCNKPSLIIKRPQLLFCLLLHVFDVSEGSV